MVPHDNSLGSEPEEDFWIFGYGSLIWRPAFPTPHCESHLGHLKGLKRRFWQGSTDHRGVPGAPGRVVTLLPDDKEVAWGIAYRIHSDHATTIREYLDYREKGGYTLEQHTFHPLNSTKESFPVYVYRATHDNEEFLGDAPIEDIAAQIVNSVGPSGHNIQYVIRLTLAHREHFPDIHDEHLEVLDKHVRKMAAEKGIDLGQFL
eukprot:Clim_evm12s21 gene=Clim_evmTU12s21